MAFESNIGMIRHKRVATPFPGSIFQDKRPSSFQCLFAATPELTTSTAGLLVPTRSTPFPSTAGSNWARWNYAQFGVQPDKLDVTKQPHIGGSAALMSAGVRTAASTPGTAPWTVQTGQPPGGWCVAGNMAVGW